MSNIEEDIKEIRESIEEAYRSYDYDLDYSPFSKGIAEILERILSERESDKKRIKELEEERDQWHGCFIVTMENSIPKQKVKNLIKNETINISGFECIAVEDIEKLVEDK